jgi:error-prone DNA polymerase
MPELPPRKHHLHPAKADTRAAPDPAAPAPMPDAPQYCELQCVSNFSFQRGASHPDELVTRAKELGYAAVALTDEASLAGIVRAHVAAKDAGLKLLVGAELSLDDAASLVLLATDRAGYGRLCRLLTVGRRRAAKGEAKLARADVVEHAQGLLAIGLPDEAALAPRAGAEALARAALRLSWLAAAFPGNAWLGAALHDGPDDRARLARLDHISAVISLPLVAVGGVDAHVPERRPVRDVVAAIRHGCTVAELGTRVPADGVRALRTREELARVYAGRPELLARTLEVAARCTFSLDELRYDYPVEGGRERLARLVRDGSRARWPAGVPRKVSQLLQHELELIGDLKYESYFLTVHDLVAFARSRGILCQGRGSAANSAVCYALGITAVDPDRFDVLFERFVSRDRNEPPDIDVDFEHERREEVLQWLYAKYGRERAAIAATVITWRGRSAVRDVGKALGLSLDQVERLAGCLEWWDEVDWPDARLREAGFDPGEPNLRRVVLLAQEIHGFPRHLSQHVGGMVMTEGRLDELCPIENAAMEGRTVLEWDKDDLDALGILKVDCLALGMLSAIRRAFEYVKATRGTELTLANVPAEDPAVYAMARRADTVGTFQIESRAQMAMLPRLKPKCFYDLVIEVAIVRPGPIQGGMVHPYLRRRAGKEAVDYPSEAVRKVLEKTLGVPIFQEQAMQLAVVAAGFTPGEADQLRRAMGAWRRPGLIQGFEHKLIGGMLARGYAESFARRVFEQLKGFGEYGFPESHAASFALITYVSCWLKRHEPAPFTCALLNSQPMGFYAPAQLVRDARLHGVEVRPVDVDASTFDCTLEARDAKPAGGSAGGFMDGVGGGGDARPATWGLSGPALRLGLRMVKGLAREAAERVVVARAERAFESVEDLKRRARLTRRDGLLLAGAGALRRLAPHRRAAWWDAATIREDAPLFEKSPPPKEEAPRLSPESPAEAVVQDYALTGLSLRAHPMSFLRRRIAALRARPIGDLETILHGARVIVAGLVINRQRPATASGVLFMTLEDETGHANLVVWRREQEKHRLAVLGGRLLLVKGKVERDDDAVVHLLAERIDDLTELVKRVPTTSRDFH